MAYNNITEFPYNTGGGYASGHGTLFFKRYRLSAKAGEIRFPAFIDSYSESYQSSWERQAVFGRSDPMQFYSGTQRVLNVTFKLVAASPEIARLQLSNLNQLISYLYPNYVDGAYSSPPIIGVKYENLIREGGDFLVGTMGNFTFTPDFESSIHTPLGLETKGINNDYVEIYPSIIELSFDFYPIHRSTLGWTGDSFMGEEFHPIFMTQKTLDKQAEGLQQLQDIFKDMYGETVQSADALQALMDFSDVTQQELEKKKLEATFKAITGNAGNAYLSLSEQELVQSSQAVEVALGKAEKAGDKTLAAFLEKKQDELKRAALVKGVLKK